MGFVGAAAAPALGLANGGRRTAVALRLDSFTEDGPRLLPVKFTPDGFLIFETHNDLQLYLQYWEGIETYRLLLFPAAILLLNGHAVFFPNIGES